MARMTAEQMQRLEAATRSVGAKLQALHDGLSAEERAVLGAVLRYGLPASGDEPDDTAGYADDLPEILGALKLIGDLLSNVSKTRADIAMTFARNARA
jgi:hypothetical protein